MRAAAKPTRVRLLSRPVCNCAVRASTSTRGVGDGQRWRVEIFADARVTSPPASPFSSSCASGTERASRDRAVTTTVSPPASRGQRFSQGRPWADHPGQTHLEVHPVGSDAQRQQRSPLLIGVPTELGHAGIPNHQRCHVRSVSDEPPE